MATKTNLFPLLDRAHEYLDPFNPDGVYSIHADMHGFTWRVRKFRDEERMTWPEWERWKGKRK